MIHEPVPPPSGPPVARDHRLTDGVARLHRAPVAGRAMRAEASEARGFFEVTEDVTQWTCADFLARPGRRTPVFARFSTIAGDHGRADTDRDPRGIALRFHTYEGDYDVVGTNTPVFVVRDAMKLQDLTDSRTRDPFTGLSSNELQWDFWARTPESAHQVTILMSDRGTPRTWRHMNGYGGHAHLWTNAAGKRHWVKYHFKTVQGIENFTRLEAQDMKAEDPDYRRRDLMLAIARGDAPQWRLEVQVMTFEDAAGYGVNPFDATKVWPHADYPPIAIGRLVLDRKPPGNDVGRAPFAPANIVPGIGARPSAHSSCDHCSDDDFTQAGVLVREVMTGTARNRLVENIVDHLSRGVSFRTRERAIEYWAHVDGQLGRRVAEGVGCEWRAVA